MNILIVKLSAIGDVIHTLPALCAIRARYPHARITWLVETAAADLVARHPALDRVIVFRRKEWIRRLNFPHLKKQNLSAIAIEMAQFWRDLRDTRYDVVIDFQGLLKSSIPVALAKSRRKIGFGRGMQHQEGSYLFLTERIAPVDMEIHALRRGLMLLSAIGIPAGAVGYDVPVTDADHIAVNDLLVEAGIHGARPLVAINPVALWDTKLWRNDRFAELADRLIMEEKVDVVFTGGPDDRPVIADIISNMHGSSMHGSKTNASAVNLAGKTRLPMLAALYRRSCLLVTTDTGPMHLAAALRTPVVALFGPTAPWRTGPFGDTHRIIRTGILCSPCFKRKCEHRHHRCMEDITTDQVMAVVREVLKKPVPFSFPLSPKDRLGEKEKTADTEINFSASRPKKQNAGLC